MDRSIFPVKKCLGNSALKIGPNTVSLHPNFKKQKQKLTTLKFPESYGMAHLKAKVIMILNAITQTLDVFWSEIAQIINGF